MSASRDAVVAGPSHSIVIDREKCIGCVACSKVCPTRALRVRDDLAWIKTELCIDCGACVPSCPYEAIRPVTSSSAEVKRFKYTVALPSVTLYGQFGRDAMPVQVLHALTRIGFDGYYDISWMCDMLATATDAFLSECDGPWPKISVTCPAIVRLVQLRYPDMIANLVPIVVARELSAKLLRRKLSAELGLRSDEIGLFFITPCTAIMNSILHPVGLGQSYLDGAMSIGEVFGPLFHAIRRSGPEPVDNVVSPNGLLWAMAGGEISAMRNSNTMAVRGVRDVLHVFDRIEAGKFQGVDFIEAYTCPDGCVSGCLTVEGRFAAQRTIQRIVKRLGGCQPVQEEKVRALLREHFFDLEEEIMARPVQSLAGDLKAAIARKRELTAIREQLPRKDCGACGAPDCASLAEDIAGGEASLEGCVFIKLNRLEEELRAREESHHE